MSVEAIEISAGKRTDTGARKMKNLRRNGQLPGVVYGRGKKVENIQVDEHQFEVMLSRHASESLIIDLKIGASAPKKVLLKEIQHHPLSQRILHVDFLEIALNKPIRIEASLEYTGTPVGVTAEGGILDIHLRTLELECLPSDMMEHIEVDVTELTLGNHLSVSDIKLDPSKYTLISGSDIMLASVTAPRIQDEETPSDEEEAAAEEEAKTSKEETTEDSNP